LFFHTVPSANTLVRWVNENAFASIVQARPCPTFGRPVHLRGSPHRLRPGTSPHALGIPPHDGHPALRRITPPADDALPPSLDMTPLIRAPEGLQPSRITRCSAHVGSEEARMSACLRPPLKLHVQFSRMQLLRRLNPCGMQEKESTPPSSQAHTHRTAFSQAVASNRHCANV